MFYVYCSADYPVYEPAEGGYYVAASKITWCHEFDTLEAAYRDFLSEVQDTENTVLLSLTHISLASSLGRSLMKLDISAMGSRLL